MSATMTATKTVLFPWKDAYSVSIPLIDKQHMKLVDVLNQLHDAMLTGTARDVTRRILAELCSTPKATSPPKSCS